MIRPRILWVAVLPLLAGCVIEPFSSPMPVPPRYWVAATQPATRPVEVVAPPPATTRAVTQPVEAPRPREIDRAARDLVGRSVLSTILKRYPASRDEGLQSYLVLVGSVITLKAHQLEGELDYVLLDTDRPLSGAVAPRTLFVSRGLLHRMEDESELAGVLAREIVNLLGDRAFKAAGVIIASPAARPDAATATRPAATRPDTAPATRRGAATAPATGPAEPAAEKPATLASAAAPPLPADLGPIAAKVAQILLTDGLGPELEQAADIEGARLAAEARYAPDGFLRLLTRTSPAAPDTPQWTRLKALDAAVAMIARGNPNADVKLPVRFETFVKPHKP